MGFSSMNIAATLCMSVACAAAAPGRVGYTLSADGLSYAVTVDGSPWLHSAPASYVIRSQGATLSTANGKLTADSTPTSSSGTDDLGAWTGASLSFNSGLFVASFKHYEARNALSLVQAFPRGLVGMALDEPSADADLTTAFPAFSSPASGTLAYVSWSGCMCPGNVGIYGGPGEGANIGPDGGPLALFNASGVTLVLSPGSAFMTSQLAHASIVNGTGCIASGHNGMLTDLPAGWVYDTLFFGGQGANDTMMAFGDALLTRTGKTRTKANADLIVSTLGYWTDNGAFYYYLSEVGKTMQDTMIDIVAYWKSLSLPLRHVMYDSWWYVKECGPNVTNTWLNCKGAVELWEPRSDVFPSKFNFDVGYPLALHNRWFGAANDYITKLGFAGSFIVENGTDFALPVKSDVFTYLMGRAKAWGMVLYEQDWLITTYQQMKITRSSYSAASAWLKAMADAAAGLGLTIQYCMPLPRHMLESTKFQVVTNARASGDYHPGASNFDVQTSSLFYWAIGIAPSKDDWWTTEVQPNSPYSDKPTEPNWQLQALVIGLSTGPNGPSDAVGLTNASLVLSTVRGDGLTLQPDRPATLTDVALRATFAGGKGKAPDVRSTWTAYLGHSYRWHHILSTQLAEPFTLALADLGPLGSAPAFAVFNWFSPGAAVAVLSDPSATFTVPIGQGQPSAPAAAHNIQHFTVVPQLPGGWWLYGEAGKVVPVSKQRIADIALLTDGFTATVLGAAGEAAGVDILVAAPSAGGELSPVHCPSSAGSTATLTCTAGACSCA